jgi:aminoglycoside phosphotransferase (APT) family kinase protein
LVVFGVHDALSWIHAVTGRRVVATRSLKGGLTSDVDAVTLDNGASLVLRRYPKGGKDAAAQTTHEASVLERIARSGIPAPRLVASKPDGDVPMLLMTRVPGRVWLTPRDQRDWVGQIARALAAIHEVPISAPPPDPRDRIPHHVEIPHWTKRPELWQRAGAVLAEPPEPYVPVFLHDDYQHFNMIWSGRRLAGVVDWCYSGPGHPDYDAAHCRLNLAILFSIEVAEHFREAYEAEKGRSLDPWWDLRGLLAYDQGWKEFIPLQVAGRAKVDGAGMDDRIEGLMERILSRV